MWELEDWRPASLYGMRKRRRRGIDQQLNYTTVGIEGCVCEDLYRHSLRFNSLSALLKMVN